MIQLSGERKGSKQRSVQRRKTVRKNHISSLLEDAEQEYRGGGKKRFAKARREAVRIGFGRLLDQGKEEELLAIAKRLPEETVQEDPQVTILYDTARALVGEL